jgi:hypothetical protein
MSVICLLFLYNFCHLAKKLTAVSPFSIMLAGKDWKDFQSCLVTFSNYNYFQGRVKDVSTEPTMRPPTHLNAMPYHPPNVKMNKNALKYTTTSIKKLLDTVF